MPISSVSKDAWLQDIAALKDSMRIYLDQDQARFEMAMIRSAHRFVQDAVQDLATTNHEGWEWHLKTMHDWMRQTVARTPATGSFEVTTGPASATTWAHEGAESIRALVAFLKGTGNAAALLTVRVGQNLPRLLRGEVAHLELVTEDNLLQRYYMEYPKLRDRTYRHLAEVVRSYAAVGPRGAQILEVGAGTGGATKVVLQAFDAAFEEAEEAGGDQGEEDGYPHYTFTDVSAGFFHAARTKLAWWAPDMDFRELDIEKDPVAQGFEAGTYDLVVASLVLHATGTLKSTLANVHTLLKPGGKLLLIETTRDAIDMQLVFGLFPGWWLSKDQDERNEMSPNAASETWDRLMRETGFTGVEFEIGDCEGEYQCTSLLVTSAVTLVT